MAGGRGSASGGGSRPREGFGGLASGRRSVMGGCSRPSGRLLRSGWFQVHRNGRRWQTKGRLWRSAWWQTQHEEVVA
jgi:hypothetical protein